MTTVSLADLGPDGTKAANRVVQAALDKVVSTQLVIDGVWGPQTKAAYTVWQRRLDLHGADADGLPGAFSAGKLADAFGFTLTVPKAKPLPSASAYLTVKEPAHDYRRVIYGGHTVNVRTREMLKLAAAWADVTINLVQGSYHTGVAASAGTHDGGGCVDVSVAAWGSQRRAAVVQALRKAGFAAWLRTPAQGFSYHIHACAIGDREMAWLAKSQVQSYFNGRNGLAGNGADPVDRHWPNWADKYNQ